jgi:osmotically-inducible protein OsmY
MTPDAKLASAIQYAFQHTGRSWLLHLNVEVREGCVVLRGDVPNFHIKQLAQETVRAVPGVAGLKNELHVADPRRN